MSLVAFIDTPKSGEWLLRGVPLFLWSVWYAQTEGVVPYVLTSSDRVVHICKGLNIKCKNIDRQWKEHAVLAEELGAAKYAILNSRFPFHEPGVLQRCFAQLDSSGVNYAYTVDREKVANGSLYARKVVTEAGGCGSAVQLPELCCRHIGSVYDSLAFDKVATQQSECAWYLPHPIKRIAVVENSVSLVRDYSVFVDSCDLVVRQSKCCNLPGQRVGLRTDMCFIVANSLYFDYYDDNRKNIEKIKDTPLIVATENKHLMSVFPYSYKLSQSQFAELYFDSKFTISTIAVMYLRAAFPEASIYVLGHDTRWNKSEKKFHPKGEEQSIWDILVALDKIKVIDEEAPFIKMYRYSVCPSVAKPQVVYIREENKDYVLKKERKYVTTPYWLYSDGTYMNSETYSTGQYTFEKDKLVLQINHRNKKCVYKKEKTGIYRVR